MLEHELDEAIDKIEAGVAKRAKKIELGAHRWEQVLRILKFYRLKFDELSEDALWYGDQSHSDSPYYVKSRNELAIRREFEDIWKRSREGET